MSANDLAAKIKELKELKRMAEELSDEIIAIEDTIKQHMTEQGVSKMTVDVFKVRWTSVTSSRFDSAAFKQTHGDLYKQYSKTTESRRFTIT